MRADVLGWIVWLVTAVAVSWSYRVVRREVYGKRPAPLEQCRENIRCMETEIYGVVVSGSLIRDEDFTAHEKVAERIQKELAPPAPLHRLEPVRMPAVTATHRRKQILEIEMAYAKQLDSYDKYVGFKSSKYCGCAICGRSKIYHVS